MIKRLFSYRPLSRILTILALTIILPQNIWAQDLTVAGIAVSGTTSNITGTNISGTVSYDAGTQTLTLNEATINGNISSSINRLKVHLIGSNIITPPTSDAKPFEYTGASGADTPSLTFESSNSEEGELTFNNIAEFGDITNNYYITNEFNSNDINEIRWAYEVFGSYVKIYYNVHYGITVNSYSVGRVNKNAVCLLSGSDAYYTPEDNTLHIPDNPTMAEYVIKSHRAELNIDINGDCKLQSIQFVQNDEFSTTSGTLTIKKGESGADKLTISDDNGVIKGFSDVTIESPMQLISPSTKDALATATSAIFSNYSETYDIYVGDKIVTDGNADDVLGDGKVSYNKQSNTLTLDGAKLTKPIFIGRESLIIDLKGANSILIDEEESSAIRAEEECALTIKSTSKTGSLSLSSSGGCSLTQGITATITKPLVSSADITNEQITKATIHPVYPPIFSNTSKTETGINVYIDKDESNGGAGTIKYSIEYADKSTGVTNQTFDPENGISMTKPGTLTAWIELDSENKSKDLIGKFFGYKQKSIREVFNGTDAVTFTPEIVPEIDENDNISVSYQSVGNASVTDNVISMSNFGSSMVSADFSLVDPETPSTRLNPDTIQVKVIAVPAAPSIPEDNSTFLNTDKITITSTAPSGTTICYNWDNGEEKTYSDKIVIEGSTLSAWVKYQPYTDAEVVYSDVTTATYTVKTDIAEYYVAPISDITYTNSAVTPTIVVKEANNSDAATLTGGTDYEVSYKKGETAITADQLINVGTYTAVITGKGDFAGTTSKTFQIVKANVDWESEAWTAPVAKSNLKYNKEAIDLITAGTTPQGTTIKYLTVFNPESYDYSESANEEWTTTAKGTAVGDYAIFYKVEGGDNYEDWGPSEVGLKATIGKGSITPTVSIEGWTYGATASTPSVTGNTGNGTVTYEYKLQIEAEGKYASTQPVNAGAYTIRAKIAETANYAAATTDSLHFTIGKASITPTVTLEGWTYGATANEPSVSGNTGGGAETFTYKAEGAETFTSEKPTAVGTHTVKVTIAETANYKGGEATAEFTISNRILNIEKDITFADGQSYASFYSSTEDLDLPSEGISVYMITGLNGNTLITQAINYIPKGTPVLVEKTATATEGTDPTKVSNNMLQYAEEDLTANEALYILYKGEYVRATGTIPAGKCYLNVNTTSVARRLTIGDNEDISGINDIEVDSKPNVWFNIDGQKLGGKPNKKGIYIKNGNKVVVK